MTTYCQLFSNSLLWTETPCTLYDRQTRDERQVLNTMVYFGSWSDYNNFFLQSITNQLNEGNLKGSKIYEFDGYCFHDKFLWSIFNIKKSLEYIKAITLNTSVAHIVLFNYIVSIPYHSPIQGGDYELSYWTLRSKGGPVIIYRLEAGIGAKQSEI